MLSLAGWKWVARFVISLKRGGRATILYSGKTSQLYTLAGYLSCVRDGALSIYDRIIYLPAEQQYVEVYTTVMLGMFLFYYGQ